METVARVPAPAPTWEFGVSLALHAGLVLVALVSGRCAPEAPPPDPPKEEVVMVELAGSAPRFAPVAQSAERAPTAAPKPTAAAPTPVAPTASPLAPPTPTTAPPPPPRQSDMALGKPPPAVTAPTTAPPNPTAAEASTDARREQILADMRRKQLLSDLGAPVGTTNRDAASPNVGPTSAGSGSGKNDPELAAWITAARSAVEPNWHPIAAVCAQNPDLKTRVVIEVDVNGRKTSAPRNAPSSGNESFDAAARRAVETTGSLPPLPPKFASGLRAELEFKAKECR
jgi:TonB family protein